MRHRILSMYYRRTLYKEDCYALCLSMVYVYSCIIIWFWMLIVCWCSWFFSGTHSTPPCQTKKMNIFNTCMCSWEWKKEKCFYQYVSEFCFRLLCCISKLDYTVFFFTTAASFLQLHLAFLIRRSWWRLLFFFSRSDVTNWKSL